MEQLGMIVCRGDSHQGRTVALPELEIETGRTTLLPVE
jgi:hypothetical protein